MHYQLPMLHVEKQCSRKPIEHQLCVVLQRVNVCICLTWMVACMLDMLQHTVIIKLIL